MMNEHFEEVNHAFNGEVHFGTLHPGSTYIWFLGRVPDLFDESSFIPRRWNVEVEYMGSMSNDPFKDGFVLDLDIEKRMEFPVDPLKRIGKDVEVVAEKLDGIRKAIPQELNLSEATRDMLRGGLPSYPPQRRPRIRRTRRPRGIL